jgi:GH15 family glucan-1,4-alpha-glucosidase
MAKDHHVAWADRIGLNKQWSRDIQECSDAFGTTGYAKTVRRFRSNIPNISNGPQLKDIITAYETNDLVKQRASIFEEWSTLYEENADNDGFIQQKNDELEQLMCERLYIFILQTLEDQGFCFYESSIEEDEMA